MPVKPCPLSIDANQHEGANRGTPMFPCGAYRTSIKNHKAIPWHWHEEVEVLVVTKGSIVLELTGLRFRIREGEGAFINSGVMQSVEALCGEDAEVVSLVFEPCLISGMPEGAIEHYYVRPLLGCANITSIHFNGAQKWHAVTLKSILDAFEAYEDSAFGYELLVRDNLSKVWLQIVAQYQHIIKRPSADSLDLSRLKEMIAFIHSQYAQPIGLKDIASAASISKRECLRCFKRTIDVSPMHYLLCHRIYVAAGLLEVSNANITQIGAQSGFESPSYFAAAFKKLRGVAPKEFRRILKEDAQNTDFID